MLQWISEIKGILYVEYSGWLYMIKAEYTIPGCALILQPTHKPGNALAWLGVMKSPCTCKDKLCKGCCTSEAYSCQVILI